MRSSAISVLVAALEHDPAGFQHIAVVAGFERLGNALLDEQEGKPILAVERGDAVEDQVGDGGRQPHRRLVQQHQARRRGDAAADRQHLLLAARQRAGELVGGVRREPGTERKYARHCAATVAAVARIGAHFEIFQNRQSWQRPGGPRHMRDAEMSAPPRRDAEKIPPLISDPSGGRLDSPGNGFEQGRLAGAVRADDRDELPFADSEGHPRKRRQPAIGDRQVVDCQHAASNTRLLANFRPEVRMSALHQKHEQCSL